MSDIEKARREKQRDMTILEWCEKRRVSKPTYYKMARMGLAPETYELPGGVGQRISPSADLAWEKKMLKLKKGKEAQRAAERRKKAAQNAANISAQSPLHISKKAFPNPAPGRRPVGRPRLVP